MAQRGLGGSGGSFGGFRGSCCLLEGSEDVPEVSWGVQGVLPLSLPLSYEGTKGPPWGHCVKVGDTVSSLRTSQGKWGHRVTVSHLKVGDTPTVSHPKVGDAPTVSHLKVGTALCPPDGVRPQSWGRPHSVTAQSWGPSQRWECPHIPTMASHPKVGDPPLGTHSVRPPLQTALFPWGGSGGHPLFLGLRFIS